MSTSIMMHDVIKLTQTDKEFKGDQGFFLISLEAQDKEGHRFMVQFLSKQPLKIEQLKDEVHEG